MTTTVAERVARGATLLDGRRPGWHDEISLDTLNLSHTLHCVLGQIYNSYYTGAEALGLSSTDDTKQLAEKAHGFWGETDYADNTRLEVEMEYTELKRWWTREIKARRQFDSEVQGLTLSDPVAAA